MAKFEVTSPDGRVVELEGNTPPTKQQLDNIFSKLPPKQTAIQKGFEAVKQVPGQVAKALPFISSVGADIYGTAQTGNPYIGAAAGGIGWGIGRMAEEAYKESPERVAGMAFAPMTGGATMPKQPIFPKDTITGQEGKQIMGESALAGLTGLGATKIMTTTGAAMKAAQPWMYEKLVKPVASLVSKSVAEFGENLSTFAVKKLGLRKETITAIKKYGYDAVINPDIAEEAAEIAYKEAMKQVPTGYGGTINTRKTIDTIGKILKENRTSVNPVYKRLQEIYDIYYQKISAPKGFYKYAGDTPVDIIKQPTLKQVKRMAAGETEKTIASEVRLPVRAWSNLRDDLTALYKFGRKEGYSNVNIFDIVDNLYDDAEKAGVKGIQNARKLTRQAHEISSVSKNATKLEKFDENKIFSLLNQAKSDPKKSQLIIDQLSPFIGESAAKEAVKQAIIVGEGEGIRQSFGRGIGELGKIGLFGGLGYLGLMKYGRQNER